MPQLLIPIAIALTITSAVFSVIAAFQTPKPATVAFGYGQSTGPTYGFGPLNNTVSNELPIPVLYGQLKIAGNVIWQTDPGTTVSRIVGLSEGPIANITDVRANDVPIGDINAITQTQVFGNQVSSSGSLLGNILSVIQTQTVVTTQTDSTYTAYLGLYTQPADIRLPDNLRPDMEMHNLAYLALTLQASDKLKGGNPTITCIAQGLLVETWDGSQWGGSGLKMINANTGFEAPEVSGPGGWTNPDYAFASDGIMAIAPPGSAQQYNTFNIIIPIGSTIAGIEVTVQGISGGGPTSVTVEISWDGGNTWTTAKSNNFTSPSNSIIIYGGLTDLWGRTWAVSEFNDPNLVIRITNTSLLTFECDEIQIETFYQYPTTASIVYSNNPVACIRDFILNQRYGLGMPRTSVDDASFGVASVYCDQLVDGPSGKEVRYQLDYIIDGQRAAQDILNDMLATFSGFLVYSGNLVKMGLEKTSPIIQYFGDGSTTKQNATFDPGNIVKDSFSWNRATLDDRPNRIRIQWVDPSQNYVKVYTQVEDRIDQDDRNTIITKDVAMLGITRQSQASRMAKLLMGITKYANFQVSFAARLESVHCEVGDVISITHQSAKFSNRLFRIAQMQESDNETILFTCTEYNASLYDDHQAAAIVTYNQPSGPNLYSALSDVTGLTLMEDNFKQKDGVFATNILASWIAIPSDELMRLGTQKIQISQDGGVSYRDVVIIGPDKTSYRIVLGNVQTGTTFTVRVKTVSDRGAESPGTVGSVTIQGKITPPSDVEDFAVTYAVDHIAMTWSSIDDADLFGYEIRVGDGNSIWETATIVTTENLGTRYDLFNFTTGTKKFFIKAIDNSGNYSENAASDSISITGIPNSNVVFTFDLFQYLTTPSNPLQGILSSSLERVPTNNYDPTYNRIALQPKPTLLFSDIQTNYATNLAVQQSPFRWGRENYVVTQESYATSVIDIGGITTGSFILDIQTFSSSNLGFVSAQISTSTDGITFTAFKSFVAGQFTARYVKFQFLIQATNASTKVRLVSAILTVDVPDVNENFLNQAISASGTVINLTGFTQVQSIVITTVGTSNLTPRISDQTSLPNSFTVVLFDTSGTLQSGSVNIAIQGY